MKHRGEWLWLVAALAVGCGSPGKSRMLANPDGGDQPGDDADPVSEIDLGAPPDGTAINTVPGSDGPAGDVPADAPGMADRGADSPPPADVRPSPDGISCQGCWDGTRCQTGSDVTACGAGGAACKVCNDGNPCTADKCVAGACDADKTTGGTCPGGVCTAGICRCGGMGEPCCTSGAACEGNQTCLNGRCGSCGSTGMPCCTGNMCAAGSVCNSSGMCEVCGGANQPCCAGSSCSSGYNCGGSGRCAPCGGVGQSCCAAGNACQANLTCGAGNTCQCGGIGQACCGGATCTDDGNPCNGAEVCLGTCQRQNPIVCTALDICHNVGTCQPSTGTCTNPPKTGGSCNDGDACTQNDTCQNGSCAGTQISCASGLRCSGGSCICDATSCSGSKTCVNNSCVSCGAAGQPCCGGGCNNGNVCQSGTCTACGALNQPCCGNACNTGLACQSSVCKTACDSRMGQACDTNTCQPGKYDCAGNCTMKAPKNCGSASLTCDPVTGQCVTCGARYGLCCTAPGVEQCSGGPDDKCFLSSSGRQYCWITAHVNQRCGGNPPFSYCKPSDMVQCDTATDICVCMFGQTCEWDDGSGMPPTPPP